MNTPGYTPWLQDQNPPQQWGGASCAPLAGRELGYANITCHTDLRKTHRAHYWLDVNFSLDNRIHHADVRRRAMRTTGWTWFPGPQARITTDMCKETRRVFHRMDMRSQTW